MGYFNAIDSLCQIIYLVILVIWSDVTDSWRNTWQHNFLFNFEAVFLFQMKVEGFNY